VAKQHGPARGCGGLEKRRHFSRVERSHPRVGISAEEQDGRILCAWSYVVVTRIGIEILKLLGVVSGPIFGYPVLRHQELLIAKHIQQRVAAGCRAEEVGTLRESRAYEQPAITCPLDGKPRGIGVAIFDKPLRRSDKIVKDILLFREHAGLMPLLPEFTAP